MSIQDVLQRIILALDQAGIAYMLSRPSDAIVVNCDDRQIATVIILVAP